MQLVGSLCKRHAVTPAGAPTACKRMVSGTISLAVSAFFSPFPHGTCSLSVMRLYLALPDGAGRFTQDFTGPALLRIPARPHWDSPTGLSPSMELLSRQFRFPIVTHYAGPTTPARLPGRVWAVPRSLATTCGITIVFFSSPYLDVSVQGVSSIFR